jgi:uncharacterized DUF497 family protein
VIPYFEWDLEKATANRRKHGVGFEEAASVFADDDAVINDDVAHADEEDRFIIVGVSDRERMVMTVFTFRSEDTVRIISSRRATPHGRRAYEQKKRSKR